MPDRPRWILHLQAVFWRFLMAIGMKLHHLAPPRPPPPTFTRTIPAITSPTPGHIRLLFYTPSTYPRHDSHSQTKPIDLPTTLYPVLINFHGGGFTLGTASDDARWCRAVVDECNAIVVSVDYRRAPEHPFPTAVEDGVDAALWVLQHAEELGVDKTRIGLSGFSAGGNMAFTVPLRLAEEVRRRGLEGKMQDRLSAIVAWYPSTDFTNSRATRRLANLRPEKELPKLFTDLFDASYLYPPNTIEMDSPYLSPGVASVELLKVLPEDICIYTCEWDELLAEAERFRVRLEGECGKRVRYKMFEGTVHGWDKSPNPVWRDPKREGAYREACAELRRVWGIEA